MSEQKEQTTKQNIEKQHNDSKPSSSKKQSSHQSSEKMDKSTKQKRTKRSSVNESQQTTRNLTKKEYPEKKVQHATNSSMGLEIQETLEPTEQQLVQRIDATTITIDGAKYEIVKDYREAFDAERLSERYSEILDKYDYVVADWGFEQLRLKGFYDNRNRKVPQDQRINNLEDYLYEYCNFGCPYFVLHRLETKKSKTKGGFSEKSDKPARKRRNQKGKNPTNQKSERVKQPAASQSVTEKKKSKPTGTKGKRDFVKKEVTPATVQKETKVAEKEKAAFKTVQDSKGKRHFSIRRKDVETKKNNE